MYQKFVSHPLWLVGFRPFFSLACLAGCILPLLWILIYTEKIPAPMSTLAPMQWHAHEMFFGFGWAMIGGFLLTATKNWVEIRGFHGPALMFLVATWLLERFCMWFGADLPKFFFVIFSNLFLFSVIAMLTWTLVRYRKTDSYRDNYFFILMLPMFLVAKNLMLNTEYFSLGVGMTIGLFRLAFLVMLERTLSQFMKSIFQVNILRHPLLDKSIKLLALLMVFEGWLPSQIVAAAAILLSLLLAVRLAFWSPHLGMRRIDLGIMYLGYILIVVQLLALALHRVTYHSWAGGVETHLFTFGVMGLIVPAMVVRISKGHTGRKVSFDPLDKAVLWAMILAFLCRIVAPQFFPMHYALLMVFAALAWSTGFMVLAIRYIPFLMQPRVDGKEY